MSLWLLADLEGRSDAHAHRSSNGFHLASQHGGVESKSRNRVTLCSAQRALSEPPSQDMPHAESFRDLLDAEEGVLHELVAGGGDAPERVWAAWSLALRRDPAIAEVARSLTDDPSPGVRAHMALLLVAHGEIDAALALGQNDAAPEVRASAWRHLARSAGPGDERLHVALMTAMRTDVAPEIRAAIADGIRLDAHETLWAACETYLADEDDEVRDNVVQALLRRHSAGCPLPDTLKVRATREKRQRTRDAMLGAWVAAEGWTSVLQTISARSVDDILLVLGDIERKGGAVPGDALDPVLGRDIPEIDRTIGLLVRTGRVRLSVDWLFRLVLRWQDPRAEDDEAWWRAQAMHDAVTELAKVLPEREAYESQHQRDLGESLHSALELEAQRVARELSVSVDAVVSYARGELPDDVFWGDHDDEDSWIDWPPGLRLIPELRRLAHATVRGG